MICSCSMGILFALEQLVELVAIARDAGRVGFGDEFQFLVEIDVGADVAAGIDGVEHFARDFDLAGAGDDGFNAGLGLRGISGIGNDDPVAVAVERQQGFQLAFPVGFGESRRIGHCPSLCAWAWTRTRRRFGDRRYFNFNSSSAQTATLPHLPEAISA